jgi:oligopeptide/dipeptide ABC transporter ATP-binding protein
MRQRVMIAMALALRPKLLIADEPTTAIDATVQAQILELMVRLQREMGMALIMITHDLGVVATIADEVMVVYAGKAVETGDKRTTYYRPHHPYTKGLLDSIPGTAGRKDRLTPILGQPPSLIQLPSGCAFHPRCPFVMTTCIDQDPPERPVDGGPGHRSACWLPPELVGIDEQVEAARHAAAERHRGSAARQVLAARQRLESPAELVAAESPDG